MKIFITASKQFYDAVREVRTTLEAAGHSITPPNGFDDPDAESQMQNLSLTEYQQWKAGMIRKDGEIVAAHDAILVLNFNKHGQAHYIGGSVFLEMFKAFELGRKIFLYNPIPEGMLYDEIFGMGPIVINGDLSRIQ